MKKKRQPSPFSEACEKFAQKTGAHSLAEIAVGLCFIGLLAVHLWSCALIALGDPYTKWDVACIAGCPTSLAMLTLWWHWPKLKPRFQKRRVKLKAKWSRSWVKFRARCRITWEHLKVDAVTAHYQRRLFVEERRMSIRKDIADLHKKLSYAREYTRLAVSLAKAKTYHLCLTYRLW